MLIPVNYFLQMFYIYKYIGQNMIINAANSNYNNPLTLVTKNTIPLKDLLITRQQTKTISIEQKSYPIKYNFPLPGQYFNGKILFTELPQKKPAKISFKADIDNERYNMAYMLTHADLNDRINGRAYDKFLLDTAKKHIPARSKVLDIGAGEGRNTLEFAKKGYKVTAFEISDVGLGLIEKIASIEIPGKAKNITTKNGSILSSYNETDKFDMAYMAHVSQHFNIDELDEVFKKMNKSLNNNGIFVFDANTQEKGIETVKRYSPEGEEEDGVASYDEKQIIETAERNGFELIEKEPFNESAENRPNYEKTLKRLKFRPLNWFVFKKTT